MARFGACCSPCQNLFCTSKEEFAGAAPTKSSSTLTFISALSRIFNFTQGIAPSLDNKLFKHFMEANLEAQVLGQIEIDLETCKQLFKTRFPDLYYNNLYIDCYQFCQPYKDNFETNGAKKLRKILFVALILQESVTQQWLKYKQYCEKAVSIT